MPASHRLIRLDRASTLSVALLMLSFSGACSTKEKKPELVPPGPTECDIEVDLSTYDFDLNIERSLDPPAGLAPENVPQFVSFGWDDNGFLEPLDWVQEAYAERELLTTFFMSTTYISDGSTRLNPRMIRESFLRAIDSGHEFGVHGHAHADGLLFGRAEWKEELDHSLYWLTKPSESEDRAEDLGLGLSDNVIYGFRAPFLHYSDGLFEELREAGIWYDCSIEEGWQLQEGADRFAWPYTLDEVSPAHEYARERDFEAKQFELTKHPGVIELPAYALVIPPDNLADEYGFDRGLLSRIREKIPAKEPMSDRITGLDYNLWSTAELTKGEVLAILKYNLDQRLSGNRAPMFFGTHSDFYRETWEDGVATHLERQEAIEEFLDYAASQPEVIVGTHKDVVDYMRAPRHIDCFK